MEIRDILNLKKLETLFKNYSLISRSDVSLYDMNGIEQLSVRNKNCICNFVKHSECRKKILYSEERAKELNGAYIFETACGLVMCITPIKIDGEVIGYITSGPVALWENDDYFEKQIIERCNRLGFDIASNNYNISEIRRTTPEIMTSNAELLMILVNYMVSEEQKYQAERTELIKLRIERLKFQREMDIKAQTLSIRKYPIELEKVLIAYVQLGEKNKAKLIINSFLNEIFSYASGNLEIMKAKLYEFTAFLSRTAVEAGALLESIIPIIKKSSSILVDKLDFSELCSITIEILYDYIDTVYSIKSKKKPSRHLANAIKCMNDDYCENLSLNLVAKKVFISPYYLSHLFRDEMDTTFKDYLTRIRIDKAKEFLSDGFTVEQVVEKIGFNDTNYFIKVFKKYVGITPSKYKKLV